MPKRIKCTPLLTFNDFWLRHWVNLIRIYNLYDCKSIIMNEISYRHIGTYSILQYP